MFIDTHCHINMMIKKEFDVPLQKNFHNDVETILLKATAQHVTKIINVGTSVAESMNCVLLAEAFPAIWAAIGTHPNDLTETWHEDIKHYKKMLAKDNHRIVAIGEIGLDYHYPDYHKQRQYDAFHAQIELALEHNLPIIVHTRDANDETLRIIETYKHEQLKGIIHCFSEDQAFAHYAIALGFLLGIGGTLTYPKNASLRTLFASLDLQHIVLETDAPFLPPQPIRGQQNHPSEILYIADFLAKLKNIDVKTVASITTQNAERLFKI